MKKQDRIEEVCAVFKKIFPGFDPDPKTIICDGCNNGDKDGAALLESNCKRRKCVIDKGIAHCGYCGRYPCDIFPAEPSDEELKQKIDIEKQWSWDEEKLMEAYQCKKYMDEFRKGRK